MSYFPEPSYGKNETKFEVDLPSYAKESYSKSAAGADTSKFVKMDDLASLKAEISKINIDELEKVPSCLTH